MTFKPSICPSCGGQLQVPDDRDSVKCMYCGTEIVVREAIQAGSGGNIHNYLELAVTATKAGNYQEAYDYYLKVLEIDTKNSEAWFGKAKAAGWLSTLKDFRLTEMKSGFQNSLAYVPDKDKPALQIQCASVIDQVAIACYKLSRKHFLNYPSVEQSWQRHITQSAAIIDILEYGSNLDPKNKGILSLIIQICKENIEGIKIKLRDRNIVRNLSPEYEKTMKDKIDYYSNLIKQLDSSFQTPDIKKQGLSFFDRFRL
jgi:tetratricopeptide (TPR) repeat protein